MDYKYLEPTDKIEKAGFSVRAFNVLSQAGVVTLTDLIALDDAELLNLKNLGRKSLKEIQDFKKGLANDPYLQEMFELGESEEAEVKRFYDHEGIKRKDVKLENIGFSVRTFNGLKRAGYTHASQLLHLKMDDLLAIKNLGKNSISEILEKIANLEFEPFTEVSTSENIKCRKFSEVTSDILNIDARRAYYELLPIFARAENEHREVDQKELFTSLYLREKMKRKILDFLTPFDFGVDVSEILALFPLDFADKDMTIFLLEELKLEEDILFDGNVQLKRTTILEYMESLEKEQWKEILIWRLEGFTLDAIGREMGITRERVRQIVVKVLTKRPQLLEDRYIEFFEAYDLSSEDFCYIFDEEDLIYNYLTLVGKRRSERKLDELMYDESIPVAIRKRAQKIVYKDYVNINGEQIYKHRFDFTDYIVRTYFQEEATFDEFAEKYHELLERLGLSKDENLIPQNIRSYENKFSLTYNKVLWKTGRKFRYYNIDSYDFSEFWQELELQQYENVEISTLKIFNEHPELMVRYDIQDEYELHNLLKKICDEEDCEEVSVIDSGETTRDESVIITFGRMPMITFGEANRDEQVLDMLLQTAPVPIKDLAEFYTLEYGVLPQTFTATFLKNFTEYFSNGIYCISADPLPLVQLNRMKEVLVGDFYLTTDVKEIYLQEFPDQSLENINSYTLKTLGFNVYTSYVVKNTYDSATSYVKHLLTSEDFVDIGKLPRGLTGKATYYSQIQKLRDGYEIIEYKPNNYLNLRHLNRLGVTKEEIQNYCQAVFDFAHVDELFTIKLLNNKGFSHSLDRLGFTETFYEALLSGEHSEFSYRRMGGVKVFCKKGEKVLLPNFLQNYIEKYGAMGVEELMYRLLSRYGMDMVRDKLIQIIKDSPMHYDPIEKKIYPDYEAYLDEANE